MDWLKDKKNQPIVIGAVSLIIIAAVVMVYMSATGGAGGASSTDPSMAMDPSMTATATQPAPDPSASAPAAAPADSGVQPGAAPAGAAPGAAPGAAVAKVGPMESWRADPFKPVGYKKPPKAVKKIPYIADLPIPDLPRYHKENVTQVVKPEPPQPTRRMAGLLLNGRVYAIIETNGRTQVVQPGDILNDGLAVVERIERDKVILKTRTDSPRYLTVRMAAAARTESAPNMPNTPTGPGGYPGAMRVPAGYPGGPPAPGRI